MKLLQTSAKKKIGQKFFNKSSLANKSLLPSWRIGSTLVRFKNTSLHELNKAKFIKQSTKAAFTFC